MRLGTILRASQRQRTPKKGETRLQPHVGFDKNETITDAWSTITPALTDDETPVLRSCVGALMYRVLDRADAQLQVGISGAYVRAPRTGAMEALRSVTRYLLGTRDGHINL